MICVWVYFQVGSDQKIYCAKSVVIFQIFISKVSNYFSQFFCNFPSEYIFVEIVETVLSSISARQRKRKIICAIKMSVKFYMLHYYIKYISTYTYDLVAIGMLNKKKLWVVIFMMLHSLCERIIIINLNDFLSLKKIILQTKINFNYI